MSVLFRHKVIRVLQRAGLLDEDRTRLLLSWRHSGFSVHNLATVPTGDSRALEALAAFRDVRAGDLRRSDPSRPAPP